jgi:hypothetical protein
MGRQASFWDEPVSYGYETSSRRRRDDDWGFDTGSGSRWRGFDRSIFDPTIVKPRLGYWDKRDIDSLSRDIECASDLKYDIYNLFLTPAHRMRMEKLDDKNQWKHELLRTVNDYFVKPLTNDVPFAAYIVMEEILKALTDRAKSQGATNPEEVSEQLQKAMDDNAMQKQWLDNKRQEIGKNNPGATPEEIEKKAQQAMKRYENKHGSMSGNNPQKQQIAHEVKQAIQRAEDRIENVKKASGFFPGEDDGGQGNTKNNPGDGAGKEEGVHTLSDYRNILGFMNTLNFSGINEKSVSDFIRKTLKMSTAHFSKTYTEIDESVFDADVISEIEGLENILPIFQGIHLLDLTTYERKYHMSFDLFIDVSGSMSHNAMRGIKRLDLAKLTALKISKMGMIDTVYPFENMVFHNEYGQSVPGYGKKFSKLGRKDAMKVMHWNPAGGTSIDAVVEFVNNVSKRPALVLTDANDSISNYSPNVYMMGLGDVSFNCHGPAAAFMRNRQLCRFRVDGQFEVLT